MKKYIVIYYRDRKNIRQLRRDKTPQYSLQYALHWHLHQCIAKAIVRITVVMLAERYCINDVCVRTEGNDGVS